MDWTPVMKVCFGLEYSSVSSTALDRAQCISHHFQRHALFYSVIFDHLNILWINPSIRERQLKHNPEIFHCPFSMKTVK
jgi:hypothetical protein